MATEIAGRCLFSSSCLTSFSTLAIAAAYFSGGGICGWGLEKFATMRSAETAETRMRISMDVLRPVARQQVFRVPCPPLWVGMEASMPTQSRGHGTRERRLRLAAKRLNYGATARLTASTISDS